MADFGYDISDYADIDPLFGDLADLDALIEAAHARGLKLLLDLVPNHTLGPASLVRREPRLARQSEARLVYLARSGRRTAARPTIGSPISAAARGNTTRRRGQYYYHAFLKEQPDLNWRNPAVRAAMHDVMRFWLRRGVDGFRVDVIWHLIKDDQFRDNPPNPDYRPGQPPHRRLHPALHRRSSGGA